MPFSREIGKGEIFSFLRDFLSRREKNNKMEEKSVWIIFGYVLDNWNYRVIKIRKIYDWWFVYT